MTHDVKRRRGLENQKPVALPPPSPANGARGAEQNVPERCATRGGDGEPHEVCGGLEVPTPVAGGFGDAAPSAPLPPVNPGLRARLRSR